MEFLCDIYLEITETCFDETKTTKRIKTHCDPEAFVYVVTSQM